MLEALQKGISEDAFIVWDVTQFGYYARTHWQVTHPEDVHRFRLFVRSGLRVSDQRLGVKVAKPGPRRYCA